MNWNAENFGLNIRQFFIKRSNIGEKLKKMHTAMQMRTLLPSWSASLQAEGVILDISIKKAITQSIHSSSKTATRNRARSSAIKTLII